MNPTKIEWTDYTWNPLTGCRNTCTFCYARRLAEGRLKGRYGYENGFTPTFHPERLQEPYKLKKPSKIFVCSMGELFGDWLIDHRNWICDIIGVVHDNPRHTFQFLTKYPQNLNHLLGDDIFTLIQPNMWLGASVTCQDDLWRIDHLRSVVGGVRFVSFEPLLDRVHHLDLSGIDWIIIGAETGIRRNKVAPDYDWIHYLTMDADAYNVPVFMKDNLLPHLPDGCELRQEFPRTIHSEETTK